MIPEISTERSKLIKALITGINGQIAYYLYKILLNKNYEIYGLCRTLPTKILPKINYLLCDLSDVAKLKDIIIKYNFDEIYNLAAQTDAVLSLKDPEETLWLNGNVVMAICETIKGSGTCGSIKLFQANSVEIYKGLHISSIDESMLSFYPKNPYAIGKLAAYWTVKYYRDELKCFCCSGIIFNTESPLRNERYVTKKIVNTLKNKTLLKVGNVDSRKDWIHAYDVAFAAWLILQQEIADDYVIGLGETHSVKEFITLAYSHLNITIEWIGDGIELKGINKDNNELLVTIDAQFFRSYESNTAPLNGNNNKLRSIGWSPKYKLNDIIVDLFTEESLYV